MEDFVAILCDNLGIPPEYCSLSGISGTVECFFNARWIRNVVHEELFTNPPLHGQLLPEEVKASLELGRSLGIHWNLFLVQIIPKCFEAAYPLAKLTTNQNSRKLSYSRLLHHVCMLNTKNLWKNSFQRFQDHSIALQWKEKDQLITESFNNVFKEVISRLYNCRIINVRGDDLRQDKSSDDLEWQEEPNLLQAICAFETNEYFFVVFNSSEFSVRNCVDFSPSKFIKNELSPLYILFQLIKATKSIQDKGLFLGNATLHHLRMDNAFHLSVIPQLTDSIFKIGTYQEGAFDAKHANTRISTYLSLLSSQQAKQLLYHAGLCNGECRCTSSIAELTELWALHELSNLDYLLCLSYFAGRSFDSPIFHPTLPWVTDFSTPNAGWRDLTKSKYRLNKGDQQLEQTYAPAESSEGQISHHIPELFDEITYYIYKARSTSKRLLQKYVRNQFVPSHYPSSMARMFTWTPAECIPEFYLSPEIFKSIHCDLPDLQVPVWCSNVEEFLRYHRDALESNYVSRRLHHWIDLTYGYKLFGNASIKSKNVCLSLVDGHEEMSKGGIVQLFYIPHPSKLTPSPYLTTSPPMPVQWTDNGDRSSSVDGNCEANRGTSVTKRSKNTDFSEEKQSIYLPTNYNPLSALQQVESLHSFLFRQTEPGLQKKVNNNSNSSFIKKWSHGQRIRDVQIIGCLIIEMFAAQRYRTFRSDSSLEIRYANAARIVRHEINVIPRSLHRCLRLIFTERTLPKSIEPITEEGLPPISCHQLLQPLINVIVFPSEFEMLVKFSGKMYQYSNLLRESRYITDCYSVDKFGKKVIELQVKTAAQDFSILADNLTTEGLQLILPYLLNLLRNPDSNVNAAWYLTEPIARILGPTKSVILLLPLLMKLFEADIVSFKSLKLFHRSFLLQLIVRFGLSNFVNNFVVYLVEGAGGYKQCLQDNLHKPDKSFSSHKKLRDIDSPEATNLSAASDDTDLQPSHILSDIDCRPSVIKSPSDRNDITDIENSLDTFFTFDDATLDEMQDQSEMELSENFRSPAGSETSLEEISFQESATLFDSPCPSPHSASISFGEDLDELTSPLPTASSSITIPNSKKKLNSSGIYSTSLPTRPQTICLQGSMPNVDNESPAEPIEQEKCQDAIAEVCCESIMWLAQRLGPVLTARHLTRNLLRMLTLCYLPEYGALAPLTLSCGDSLSVTRKRVVGDRNSSKIILCLLEIAGLYGEQMIQLQYLAHITELIGSCEGKLNSGQEAGLIGAMVLFQEVLLQLSDPTFMEHLQGTLIRSAVYPVIRLLSSVKVSFPSGSGARRVLAWRVIDSVFLMSIRIGREMSMKKLTLAFTRLLSAFDKVSASHGVARYDEMEPSSDKERSTTKERAILELKEVFTPELAYYSYVPLCRFLGTKYMEGILPNHDLLRTLCLQYDENHQADHAAFNTFNGMNMSEIEAEPDSVEINVAVRGNRIDIKDQQVLPEDDAPFIGFPQNFDISRYVGTKMEDNQRHLRGNWLAYWEHEIGRSERENSFYFKQIRLQSFVGHTSVVKSLCILDNENSFMSSSKDKTVKLWSLRNIGDGSTQCHAQWTYANHKKSVFNIAFCESQRLAASCDSTVHIWDPFIGKCLKQLDSLKHSPVTVLLALPPPSCQLVTATSDATLKFIDLRTFSYSHELKISASSVGIVRCVAVSADCRLIGVAHSSGVVSSLDLRTGQLLSTLKLHEGDVRALQWYEKGTFISAAVDQSLCVWNTFDSKAKFYMKGPTEPVQFMRLFGSELITGSTGNRIGVHTQLSPKAGFSSTKLRTEAFKGCLTALQLLPLNRQLMLGSDSGSISLLC